MSRVKERLKQYKLDLEKQTQYKQGLPGSALDIVNTLLADLEEDEKKNGWIPAKEKPSEYGRYLVTFKQSKEVYIAEYGICQMPVTVLGQPLGCGWYSSTGYYYAEDSIVAWKPLPEHSYKEDEVLVTVEYPDGTRVTEATYTIDGKWKMIAKVLGGTVIAWKPFPEPYKEN